MTRLTYIFPGLVLMFLIWLSPFCSGANQTITTYYPVANGSYQTLRLYPHDSDIDPTGACAVGTLYVNYSDIPRYCANVSGTGTWGPIPDIWTQNGDYIYPTDTNPNLHVGIGTKTPEFKLSLINDGGILAQGTFGAGVSLPNLGLSGVSEFLWYPKKAAFRAGQVQSGAWNDEMIGNYSVAFGTGTTASGSYSVSTGSGNTASGEYSISLGGFNNTASLEYAAVIGGAQNTASGRYSIVTGGQLNQATADYSAVLGGGGNKTFAEFSLVGGGDTNEVSVPMSNINGGTWNSMWGSPPASNIIGYSVIGGGEMNYAWNGNFQSILGGKFNEVRTDYGSIGGGNRNSITGIAARISGGKTNQANQDHSTICGGQLNIASGFRSAVAGGYQNTAGGDDAVVAGGANNTASGKDSMVLGGSNNTAAGDYSWAGGRNMKVTGARTFAWGYDDQNSPVTISASDAFIIAPGSNAGQPANPKVGIRTTAPNAILEINANNSSDDYFNINKSSSGDILLIKKNANDFTYLGIGRPDPSDNTYVLQVGTSASAGYGAGNGAYVTSTGQWKDASSRTKKDNIRPLNSHDAEEVLDGLRPVTFDYKIRPKQKQAGFIAEDVPELTAMPGRDKLSNMSLIAVLTKVAQDQDRMIENQNRRIQKLKRIVRDLKEKLGE